MSKRVLVVYRDAERLPPYRDALKAAGLDPQIVEVGSQFPKNGYHGLLLMGGQDVDPALYGESKHEQTDAPDRALDESEMAALQDVLERDLPVLAICRGMQLLNVHHGGTLVQHLSPVDRHRTIQNGDRSLPVHSVSIVDNTLLARVAGSNALPVNSRHHQAVKEVGRTLRVSAINAEDGVVEAIERSDRTFVLGVQWHPEDQIRRDAAHLRLFEALRDAMGR